MSGFKPYDTNAASATFNPTDDIAIERLIEGVSLAADQQPIGLGIANAINVEFGAAVGTGSDPVQLDINGQLTFNTAGLYRIKVVFHSPNSRAEKPICFICSTLLWF